MQADRTGFLGTSALHRNVLPNAKCSGLSFPPHPFPGALPRVGWDGSVLELCAEELGSAAALGGLMTGGGGAPRIFHRRRRRGFMVGGGSVGGGVRPDERALKQRTRWTGVFFSGFTGVIHFTCDLRGAAGGEKLTVNMHAVHNFTVLMS